MENTSVIESGLDMQYQRWSEQKAMMTVETAGWSHNFQIQHLAGKVLYPMYGRKLMS